MSRFKNLQGQEARRRVLERLLRVWDEHPGMSLGQLIRGTTTGVLVEYLFDDELIGLMELSVSKHVRRTSARELPLTTPG